MSIPPTSFLKYDISDPACYPGSGTVITDLEANLDGVITSAGLFVSDGQQSYINITSGSERLQSNAYNFPVRNVYTISSIFKISAQFDYNCCLSLAEGDGSGTVPFFGVPFNTPNEFNIPTSSNGFGIGNINGNLKLQNDTWNLLTLTADGTTQKLYLNGILVGSVAHTASFNGANPRLQTGYPGTALYFAPQKVAIMQMWESALTATQVKDLADSYRTRFSLYQPVISYDFSVSQSYPGSGSTVFDLAGSVDLTITNVTFISNGQSSRFHFNGLDSYLSTTGVAAVGSVFTVNFWGRYIQGANSFQKVFNAGRLNATGQGPLVIFDYGSPGTVGATMNYNGKGTVIAGGIASQEWYFISYVLDGTTAKLYVNGVLTGSDAQDSTSWLSGAFAMGTRVNSTGSGVQTGDFFEGDIGILDVYNTALSAGDITTLYDDTVNRFYPPPVSQGIVGGRQLSQGFNG